MSAIEIKWDGDLDDDCSARVGTLLAHCECMGGFETKPDEEEGEDSMKCEYWFCAVYNCDGSEDVLFHSSEPAGMIIDGTMARAVCEAIIKAYFTPAPDLKKRGGGDDHP